jgi:hypothetical protein
VPAAVKCSSEETFLKSTLPAFYSVKAELKEKLLTLQTFSLQWFIDTKSTLFVFLSSAPPNKEIWYPIDHVVKLSQILSRMQIHKAGYKNYSIVSNSTMKGMSILVYTRDIF